MSQPNSPLRNDGRRDGQNSSFIEPQERMKRLSNVGNAVTVDPNVPIQRYFRSGMEMVRMAKIYHTEGNRENAYILYMKYMTLFLEKILTHPEYKAYPNVAKRANKERLRDVLIVTEKLRQRMLAIYEFEYEQQLQQLHEQQKALYDEQQRAAAQFNDVKRKDAKTKQPAPWTGPGASAPPLFDASGDFSEFARLPKSIGSDVPLPPSLDQVMYPNDFPPAASRAHQPGGLLLPDPSNVMPKPSVDRTLKPTTVPTADGGGSLLEGRMRTVTVPGDTCTRFLSLALHDINRNRETCGILAGVLAHNTLRITHVIVPKQCGTADSCTTMSEEDIFDVQDQQNLITLGWIHTHPSQTAFLSSVDLHTHCSYQMMMPEAIAIVCAPKHNTSPIFCLTPDYGLDYIAGCRQSGFHPHPDEPPLFMVAPHARIENSELIQVVDLR